MNEFKLFNKRSITNDKPIIIITCSWTDVNVIYTFWQGGSYNEEARVL